MDTKIPAKLSVYLLGRHYEISTKGVSEGAYLKFAWLENQNVDVKELLKAYLQKCQECAKMEESLERLCDEIESAH